jgi:lipoprotein-anchoring transpeptidase ErfK/SrfK
MGGSPGAVAAALVTSGEAVGLYQACLARLIALVKVFGWTAIVIVVAVGAVLAQRPEADSVEPLPTERQFHPAYTLVDDEGGSGSGEQAEARVGGTERGGAGDEAVEPLPDDDAVAQGFALATWEGDIEGIEGPATEVRLAMRRLPHDALGAPAIAFISPMPEEQWVEGAGVTLKWLSAGAISKVRIYYSYDRCKLAGRSRGNFGALVTAMTENRNELAWASVPWIDSANFRLRIAGYDADERLLASDEIGVRFRPKEFTNIPATCIAISKRKQRLYYYVEGKARRVHVVSTGRGGMSTPQMWPGSYSPRRGSMGKVFRKSISAWSGRYHCQMPYWLQITSSGSHGIHATSPPFYRYLGSPASHGCVRQHRADASVLYKLVPVGTAVYIF